jgi:signal transduction histidine kinase/streptogramin lyase
VVSILEDRQGTMWIGTDGGGLNSIKNGKFSTYTTREELSSNMIRPISEDREGNLWIGTYGGGLNRMKNGKFTVYTTKQGLVNNKIRVIHQDRRGNLWIGTEGGLNRLVLPNSGDTPLSITTYTTKDGLVGNVVRTIYEDREGNLWIGTYSGGLNRLKNGKFTSITTTDGLFDETVYHILEDNRENLWMGCNKGIFQVPRQELNDFCDGKLEKIHCISYDDDDGMKSRECNGISWPSAWKSRDGTLWFPTKKGAVRIDPGKIETIRMQPPLKIEAIKADNREILLPFFTKDQTLIFSPGTERFEIKYTALSFLAPKKVRFKYKLEGYDLKWIDVGPRRTAYYTKLPPGNFTFRVKACNSDGIWNETGASFPFYLKPYFYQTWWFYMMVAVILLLAAFGIYRLRVRQLTHHKMELERVVTERTHQLTEANKKLQELDRMKTDFLSFASHELRTPLTSVLGFARIIQKRLDQRVFPLVPMDDKKTEKAVQQVASNLDIIVSEGLRLTELINNVLDITKMEEGKIEWKKETVSIASVLESAREATAGLFENKPLKMMVEVREPLPDIQGDKDRLVQVFINLISNAVKFTEKGTLTCRAWCSEKEIRISVTDTGIGIAEEDLPTLFEKFKQVSDTLKTTQKGTGLGLPICKQIVEYHGGEITVESQLGKGTTFTVKLPVK